MYFWSFGLTYSSIFHTDFDLITECIFHFSCLQHKVTSFIGGYGNRERPRLFHFKVNGLKIKKEKALTQHSHSSLMLKFNLANRACISVYSISHEKTINTSESITKRMFCLHLCYVALIKESV